MVNATLGLHSVDVKVNNQTFSSNSVFSRSASWLLCLLGSLFGVSPYVGVVLCRANLPGSKISEVCSTRRVVIADPKVAKVYAESLERLGVDLSKQKSWICFEFAKRFRVRCGTKDLSWVKYPHEHSSHLATPLLWPSMSCIRRKAFRLCLELVGVATKCWLGLITLSLVRSGVFELCLIISLAAILSNFGWVGVILYILI